MLPLGLRCGKGHLDRIKEHLRLWLLQHKRRADFQHIGARSGGADQNTVLTQVVDHELGAGRVGRVGLARGDAFDRQKQPT